MGSDGMSRRELLAAGAALPFVIGSAGGAAAPVKGRIKQSASMWCYRGVSLDQLCVEGKKFGLMGVDLLRPNSFPTLKKHGMVCTMTSCNGIARGFNRTEHHDQLIRNIRDAIDATAAAGFPNVICFSGNCKGMSHDEGLENCTAGLKKVVGYAEKKGVTLCMEYLNTKNHRDYMCADSKWAFELVKRVGSPRFTILYDIYHVAMMEAEIVEEGGKKVAKHNIHQLIKDNIAAIGHFHTGGYPGRKDLDDTQLLDWPALMRTIAEAGYTGYVAHEFIPKAKDPKGKLAALEHAVKLCDV